MPTQSILSAPPAEVAKIGLPRGCRLVLGAGRLVPEKAWITLIDALQLLLPVQPDVCAVIFGEGKLRNQLAQHISASPSLASRVLLEPFTQVIWSWMHAAEVVVSNSLFEGNPNFVIEAMLAQRPLVVSDIGAHREILDEASATFCDRARLRMWHAE